MAGPAGVPEGAKTGLGYVGRRDANAGGGTGNDLVDLADPARSGWWRLPLARENRGADCCALLPGDGGAGGDDLRRQLLPFLERVAHSQRDAGYGSADWAMPASGWANLLCAAVPNDPYQPGLVRCSRGRTGLPPIMQGSEPCCWWEWRCGACGDWRVRVLAGLASLRFGPGLGQQRPDLSLDA